MRHGRCKFTPKSKSYITKKIKDEDGIDSPIFGSFENDKLNGVAMQDGKTVLFKNGMRVVLSGRELGGCQIYRNVSQITFLIGVALSVYMGYSLLKTDQPRAYGFFTLAAVIYFVNLLVSIIN